MPSTTSKRLVILNRADLIKKLPSTDGSQKMHTLRLRFLNCEEKRIFLIVADQIFELVSYTTELGSVFIDDYVQSECLTFMASRFDFIYFLISMSHQVKNEYRSLEQLTKQLIELNSDEVDSNFLNNVAMPKEEILEKVFDTQMVKETLEVRFNEAKCINWLTDKIEDVEGYLVGCDGSNDTKSRIEAYEIMCQYLDKEMCEILRKKLNMTSPLLDTDNSSNVKRAKMEVKTEITI